MKLSGIKNKNHLFAGQFTKNTTLFNKLYQVIHQVHQKIFIDFFLKNKRQIYYLLIVYKQQLIFLLFTYLFVKKKLYIIQNLTYI